MDLIKNYIDVILHLDKHLNGIFQDYGLWIYLILFLIIFCETALIVTPFLPGDSLLFAVGALAAGNGLKIEWLMPALIIAAISGDAVNYRIGSYFGPKIFNKDSGRFLNRAHLARTRLFYEKYGGKTIIIARFVPIIRTFAPFVAGIGRMDYWYFTGYNIIGGVLWIVSFLTGGYLFGQLPLIKANFTLVVLGVIGISLLPMLFEFLRVRYRSSQSREA
ncbi:MAG: DedA family protein [Nitrospiria bacterium]